MSTQKPNSSQTQKQKSSESLDQITTSILKQSTDQQNSKKRKRKSVRFNETIFMENENRPINEPPEKGHFQVEDYFSKPDEPSENIHVAKRPMLKQSSYPSSLDETISLTGVTSEASNDTRDG